MDTQWPALPREAWRDTCETLHRYVQIIGKVQLATTPRMCHFWNVAFNVTARGLATSALAFEDRTFDVELDFVDHTLTIRSSDGGKRVLPLRSEAVADFEAEVMGALAELGIRVAIWDRPVELFSESIPFPEDRLHHTYDPAWASRFWRVVSQSAEVLSEFRSRFIGKSSPVGFYWGTFNLCAARYSGRRAANPPSGVIEGEAFSHEVSEVGFWPGDVRLEEPSYFALHAPTPEGYSRARVLPSAASWNARLGCFLLPYEAVRTSPSPRQALLDFFESTYAAGASLAGWDRAELERAA